ncbi:hypothetical protein [Pseudomonas poae]|uniref:Uncharacterized protein n=1 Tax=Pseudomonas poae TaxID=200451 RepID=A0A2S9ETK3_9PSED|nr:hypothetical protein [Pseudomonas poae]PRA28002.1 hypothetical protein CQZ97_16960 [Pseudomonas poae]PRC19105.1 hypothetical protein CQZ99_12430 [Pseudomonas poae]
MVHGTAMILESPSWVERRATELLGELSAESIAVYQFLSDRFAVEDPAQDWLFQFVYRSFYRLDSAGLSADFKERYFELMSIAKSAGTVDLREIARELGDFPNLKGQSSLQFSFATKMAATVCPHKPIYDTEVASIFGFQRPPPHKPFEVRLEMYLLFYSGLQKLYDQIIEEGAFKQVRAQFRSKFRNTEGYVSDHKALDFIFWAAGRYKRRQAEVFHNFAAE